MNPLLLTIIIVGTGQSNMSGRGELPGPIAHERVFLFANDGELRRASEPWDEWTNQIDPVSRDRVTGVGPMIAMANVVAERGVNVILVPCAKGATFSWQWRPDALLRVGNPAEYKPSAWPVGSVKTLHGACLAKVARALAWGRLGAIVHYQGTFNSYNLDAAERWAEDTQAAFDGFRLGLGDPLARIIYVRLPATQPGNQYPYWQTVRSQQESLQRGDQVMVDAPDGGGTHLDTPRLIELGERLAEAFLR